MSATDPNAVYQMTRAQLDVFAEARYREGAIDVLREMLGAVLNRRNNYEAKAEAVSEILADEFDNKVTNATSVLLAELAAGYRARATANHEFSDDLEELLGTLSTQAASAPLATAVVQS